MKEMICVWGWLMIITLCCPDSHAAWSHSSDFFTIDLSGSFRSVNAGIRNYEEPALFGENNTYDGFSQSILRVTSDGIVMETVRYEIHVVNEIYAATSPSFLLPGSTQSRSGTTRYRITKPAWYLAEDSDFSVTMNADRMNIQVSFPAVDITLGRQAINFSQAYFWNPLDVFLPFEPESFDRDYKPGVDALRADIILGSFSSLSLVGSTGRRLSIQISDGESRVTAQDFGEDLWYATALIARYRTTLQEWDLSIQAGKIYGGYQIGTGFSGEIGPVGLRGEASWFQARGDSSILIADPDSPTDLRSVDLVKNHLSCVIGMDHRFENSLYLNLEYLYNKAGDDDHLFDAVLRSAIGETVSLSEHLTGLQATYDIHPLLTGGFSLIYSLSDASSLLSPSLSYSVADESEFLAGALLGFGKRPEPTVSSFLNPESEFGTYPNIVYAEFKFYF